MELKHINKLKKRIHKRIASLQDILIDIIYETFPNAVFHGGTSIWRCYKGTRFSEDIDIYLNKTDLKKKELLKEIINQRNLTLKKFKVTDNTIFAKISQNDIEVRFEASFLNIKNKEIIIKPYETVEGFYTNVFTLSAKELIKEKISAYNSRRLIRDIYDIYILLNFVESDNQIKKQLQNFISNYKEPKDESVLKTLIFTGAIPTSKQILLTIKKWAR